MGLWAGFARPQPSYLSSIPLKAGEPEFQDRTNLTSLVYEIYQNSGQIRSYLSKIGAHQFGNWMEKSRGSGPISPTPGAVRAGK
jgi:hypothetical protein